MLWNPIIPNETGPYRVLLARDTLVDERRDNQDGTSRNVPFKVYYPSQVGLAPCPVILWSHGYGGSQDGAGFLARHLTSYGYVLIHLTHSGTDSSLWEGQKGHPWDILKNLDISKVTTLNRYRDVSFIIDNLADWLQNYPDIAAVADLQTIGMSGHSFGAITTQIAAGQLTTDEHGALISLKDDRIRACIAYSPVPGMNHIAEDKEHAKTSNIYSGISIPMLHMTGTEDFSPISDIPYIDRLTIFNQTLHAPKAVLVKAGGDHMVYNGTRGQLAANPLRNRHEELIKTISLAWWDMWLKEDEAARDWLCGHALKHYIGEDATWAFEGDGI
jgi:predicted dienelactone hydrolase